MKSNLLLVLLLSFITIQVSYAQKTNKKIKISGTVVDAGSRPVDGAIILIDGVQTNVSTNSSGEYSIRVLPTAKSITAMSLFSNSVKTIDIDGRTVVNIIFDKSGTNTSTQVSKANETADIGYGTSEKNQTAASGSKTNLSKATSKSYLNIYDMIKSEVPGVQVVGTSVRLQQGTTSLSSPTEVLFEVDGTIVNQIDGLIPSQVRSISLLKGSAASIYGARGANGVLVFTTNK